MRYLAALALLVVGASAQVVSPGPCPPVTVQQNFDIPNYLNRWYEQKKYFTFFEQNGVCVSATYGLNPNGTVEVRNYLINADTNQTEVIVGNAVVDSDTGEAKLLVNFPSAGAFAAPYWVLETDYTRFSVVWSCAEIATENVQFAWVLTRERFPDTATLNEVERVISANQLADKFLITSQDNCPEDPLDM